VHAHAHAYPHTHTHTSMFTTVVLLSSTFNNVLHRNMLATKFLWPSYTHAPCRLPILIIPFQDTKKFKLWDFKIIYNFQLQTVLLCYTKICSLKCTQYSFDSLTEYINKACNSRSSLPGALYCLIKNLCLHTPTVNRINDVSGLCFPHFLCNCTISRTDFCFAGFKLSN